MKLEVFDFNSAAVRVCLQDGEPWFVAADVCRVLEIANSRDAVAGLDDDEKGVGSTDTLGGPQKVSLISESGLYALVFKSRKPEAKVFRKWLTAEVLPALRKVGAYAVGGVAPEVRLSLWRYVREELGHWPLERQIEFGMTARRYAKAMGCVFETATEPGLGRVFVLPREVLDVVKGSLVQTNALPDGDAAAFAKLLEALAQAGHGELTSEKAREIARTSGLFPRIFHPGASEESVRSAFGLLCQRFNGSVFPGGLCLHVRRAGVGRRYEIKRETAPAGTIAPRG